ncbi:hypothetical protein Y032_0007g3382 [Ancylostoma ceylanicum]|uniref:Uncharacterized protein n=1 Tax=Ancylostoma ceylanicum TaxID=53326 RepID=A0A016VNV6_9BILA|nr:hypothetical protein Y032_0007g3382 [Ancylostoma ceylanicum]
MWSDAVVIEVDIVLLRALVFEICLQIPQSLKQDVCGHCRSLGKQLPIFDAVYAPPDSEHNLLGVYIGFRDASCTRTFVIQEGTTVNVRVRNLFFILGEWVLKPRVGALQRVSRK